MDTSLVTRAQRGDRGAFETLAADAIDRLYGAALLIVHDVPIAQDAVQEALIRAWRGLPRLRDPNRFTPWLHRILANSCLDAAKQTRMGVGSLELSAVEGTGGFEAEVDERDEVSRALASLTHQQRAVLVLRYFLGLSVPELADALGIPLGTAKSRLHHALAAMRAAIDADGRVPAALGGLA